MNDLESPSDLGLVIRNFSPDYVCLSVRNIEKTDSIENCHFLNKYKDVVLQIRDNFQARIIFGISGFTILPNEFMNSLNADYGIAGAKYIFITDFSFNADYDHSRDVARSVIKAGISIP
jgi:hypothetical protein